MTNKQQREYVAKTGISTCPFCGGIAETRKVLRDGYDKFKDDPDAYAHYVACLSCATEGPWSKSGRACAILKWNRRAKRSVHGNMTGEALDELGEDSCRLAMNEVFKAR